MYGGKHKKFVTLRLPSVRTRDKTKERRSLKSVGCMISAQNGGYPYLSVN